MESDQRAEIVNFVINEVIEELKNEISIEMRQRKRMWERKWITRRNEYGASATLLKELAGEDKVEYFSALRMSEESFSYLLSKVEPMLTKKDTVMRCALAPKLKLHVVLYYLATGNSFRSLSHFFRVSKASISVMLPEVCEAIYQALKDFIQVRKTIYSILNIY